MRRASRVRLRLIQATFVASALLVAGCDDGDRTVTLLEASTAAGSRAINVVVESCNANPRVEVVEVSEDEVRVRVVASGGDDGDCADASVLCFPGPLDGRRLIDESTGEIINTAGPDAYLAGR